MRRVSIVLISLVLISCQKQLAILPRDSRDSLQEHLTNGDTIPDNAEIKIRLKSDSLNTDETAIVFDHQASTIYNFQEDAPYFPGLGQVSLGTVSSDGRTLAINKLPFASGMFIRLDVKVKKDGTYLMGLSYQKSMPACVVIWLKDKLARDSVNILAKPYYFNVHKADTNSFGKNRFTLVLKIKSL